MQQTSPILITGAAQRIGLHCARRLLEQGHQVIVSYRQQHATLSELQDMGATCLQADFASEQGINCFIDRLQQHTTSLRAIIHNASSWLADSAASGCQPLSELFHVHMLAPYLINLRCAAMLRQCSSADIIHISDDVTRRGSSKRIAYSATKAGLENMTLSFAASFAPHIKVNCITPAMIMQHAQDDEKYLQQARSKSVMHSIPGPEVVFQAIQYLLESTYTTGATLPLNGGRHLKN